MPRDQYSRVPMHHFRYRHDRVLSNDGTNAAVVQPMGFLLVTIIALYQLCSGMVFFFFKAYLYAYHCHCVQSGTRFVILNCPCRAIDATA